MPLLSDLVTRCVLVRRFAIGFAVCTTVGACGASVVSAAARGPSVKTNRSCYAVGQAVVVTGSRFAPDQLYDLAVDDVDFGQNRTNADGGFTTQLVPGGFDAGVVQSVDILDATDGTRQANTNFTVTRRPGARFLAATGNPRTLRARFQVWGFGLHGHPVRHVYLHYIAPSGQLRATVALGRTGGQCGYLLTRPLRVFPFQPSVGNWRLQIDATHGYTRHTRDPVAQIRVQVAHR